MASTEGGLKFLKPRFWEAEEVLSCFARHYVRPGSVVWDVGANIGFFAFAAAGLAGPTGEVLAIEPDAWLVSSLRHSARRLIDEAPVKVVPCALADHVGTATFNIARNARATNHLETATGWAPAGGVREVETVVVLTLDNLAKQHSPPTVLKIDVEGAELSVLRGGSQLLEVARPVMLVEVHPAAVGAVSDLLHEARYSLRDAETGYNSRVATWSTLAVPD